MSVQEILFCIPGNILVIYSLFRIICTLFDRSNVNKWLEMAGFIACYLVNTGVCIVFQQPMLNLLSILIPLFGITFLYPAKLWQRLTVCVLIYAFAMLVENLVVSAAIGLGTEHMQYTLSNLASGLSMFTLSLVLQKRRAPYHLPQLDFFHWLAILFIPAGSMALIMLMFVCQVETTVVLATTIILLLINILVFYLFDMLRKYYADQERWQLVERQNRAYRDQFALMHEAEQHVRTLRHDMNNHLSILRQYANEGRTEELEQYLDVFARKLSPKAAYITTGNRELDSILNYKLGQAEAAGAMLLLDVSLPEQLVVEVFDLNVVLGNLLDNATEGLGRSSEKRLSLYLRLDRGVFYIKISNSYDGVVYTEAAAEALRFRTRKKDSTLHGLGLESVKATVEKYHGYLEISHQDKQFIVEAVLYTA